MTRKLILLLLFGWGMLLLLNACGSENDGETGTVRLSLTDAADHNFSQVVVSIKEIRAVPAGQEGAPEGGLPLIVSFATPKTVNVLDLVFQQELLGEAVLPVGAYNQLRLVLDANTDPDLPVNYMVRADDPDNLHIPLNTPSGQESGLKVVGHFDVASGEITAVVLDFDPARAVHQAGQSGKWQFQPTGIRVVQTDDVLFSYGAVSGQVVQEVTTEGITSQVPVTAARVYAIPQGGAAAIAAGAVNPEDGTFRLFLPNGTYALKITADGFQELSSPAPFEVSEGIEANAGILVMAPAIQPL